MAVDALWRLSVKPLVLAFMTDSETHRAKPDEHFDAELEGFVSRINDLVLAMERDYASNTKLLRTVQAALVLLAILGTAVLVRFCAVGHQASACLACRDAAHDGQRFDGASAGQYQ